MEKIGVTDRILPTTEIIKNAYETEVTSFLRSIEEVYALLLYNRYMPPRDAESFQLGAPVG